MNILVPIAFICLSFLSMPLCPQQSFVLGSAGTIHPVKLVNLRILEEAYNRLGFQIEYKEFPAERSL